MTRPRSHLALWLIRLARRVTPHGLVDDYLAQAEETERECQWWVREENP